MKPRAGLWTLLHRLTPVSWWMWRENKRALFPRIYIYVMAKAYWSEENRCGRL